MATRPEHPFIQNAPRHLQAILRSERALTRYFPREKNFQRDRLAYRAIDSGTAEAGGCIDDVGLFSRGRGDIQDPWQRPFIVHHLTDGKGRNEYADHHALSSPYMSISTSPERIVKFTKQRLNQREIAIIDMDMFEITGVKYRSTAELEKEFKFRDDQDGRTYTTESHYLVFEHIPQCCILGYISAPAFVEIWAEKLKKTKQNPNYETLNWHDDLEGNANIRETSAFGRNPRFEAESPIPHHAQPTTPATTGGRIRRTVNVLENTTLDPHSPRNNKRVRDGSPDRGGIQGAASTHDRLVRQLWPNGNDRN